MEVRSRGFTLIELMIVTAVIAILASVAIPSYRQHVVRSVRTSAQAAMMDIAVRQQQFLLANRAYADKAALQASGYAPAAEVTSGYDWDVTRGVDNGRPIFTITFTPRGGQSGDVVLTLNEQGVKTPPEKWRR